MVLNKVKWILAIVWIGMLQGAPLPIGFSIPEVKIVREIPKKELDFAPLIPGNLSTYIYRKEEDYYRDYQRSLYAVTCKKAGWDCLRHYEILANGCIPYFIDLDQCDEMTLYFFPKELIKEAMELEGVSYMQIDHKRFDQQKYDEILSKLLDYTRNVLSSRQMAAHLLKQMHYTGTGKILFLSEDLAPDYQRCLTLIGLKELLGDRVVDVPRVPHLYKNYQGNIEELYGLGMSYTKILEDLPIDRSSIGERIAAKEFDLIIYGSVHRGTPYLDLVRNTYPPEQIAYLCGEDAHNCAFSRFQNLFLREYNAYE